MHKKKLSAQPWWLYYIIQYTSHKLQGPENKTIETNGTILLSRDQDLSLVAWNPYLKWYSMQPGLDSEVRGLEPV